ncbi:hypothetical protein BS50DRAFT_587814 [Corynespora cassiicola Philippines]|uniref:R3H domain-containing protein n=1 Tax=Corynespora cassiicola Philippines TaxID=1448308 RepID=A0A2T2NMT5_CORCC|nr:hypothetical protein BS50DRAFT_587814 [Corynespora cassiicola Philippines]
MCIESELELEYAGAWITAAEARFVKIKSAIERIAPRQKADKHRQLGENYHYGELRETLWSQETKWSYAKLANENEEEVAFKDLKLLAELSINKETATLYMDPCRSMRRELQHNITQDLGFKTGSQGDGSARQVVVWKIPVDGDVH